jgi:hypothetical protein
MPRHLHEIMAAMNAYPWTRYGPVLGWAGAAPRYCAIGALLRHAGVPRECIMEAAAAASVGDVSLLQAKYGVSGADAVLGIIAANHEAQSQADATWRVLGVVAGTRESDPPLARTGPTRGGPWLPPAA